MKTRLAQIDVDGLLSPAAVEEYVTGSRKTPFPLLQYTQRGDKFAEGLLTGRIGLLVDGLPLGYLLPVDMLSPAAVEEYVTGSRKTPFPLLQYTQRGDKFAEGLLTGRIGLLVDGLPLGYLLPVDIGYLMTSQEDEGVDYLSASFIRILRYGALLLSLLLPGIYVAMATFHQQMIPLALLRSMIESKQSVPFSRILRYGALLLSLLLPGIYVAMATFHQQMIPLALLRSMIESKQSVPFSTVTEVAGLLLAFELLQQAGIHLPKSIGQSVSIIGGIVVGTAAVEASLISPAALIVVSLAGVCGFALPNQELAEALRLCRLGMTAAATAAVEASLISPAALIVVSLAGVCGFALPNQELAEALRLCRLGMTAAAAFAGMFGIAVGWLLLLRHLSGLESMGLPYLAFAGMFGIAVGWLLLLRHLSGLESMGLPYLAPFSQLESVGILRTRLVRNEFRPKYLKPLDRRRQK